MKTATTALAALVLLASSAVACSSTSSGSGSDIDTGTAISSLRTPTGSFSEATAGKAFGSYRSDRANSSKISTPSTSVGSMSTGTRTASIRMLDKASAKCGSGQSCACPNGGSLTYSTEAHADDEAIKVSFDACGFEDGWGFDGKAVLLASKKSLLGTPVAPASAPDTATGAAGSAGSTFGNEYVSILLAAKGVASNGANKLELELALVTEAHYAFLAVKVADGKVVVGISDDGHAIVKSKEGTWTCDSSKGGWSCTSDSGKSMTVVEDAASDSANDPESSADAPTDAPTAAATP